MMPAMTVSDTPVAAALPASAAPREAAASAAETEAFELTGFLALVAPEWFRLIAWVGLTAVVHAFATVTDSPLLTGVKWLSYLLLFAWVSHKIDRALLWCVRRWKAVEASIDSLRFVVAIGIGGTLIPILYIFVQYLVIVLVSKLGS